MKFGVVQCPRCKTAKGIRLKTKSAKCLNCGKRMDLKNALILSKVDNEKELASAVMKYNTKLKGGEDVYAKDLSIVNNGRSTSTSKTKMLDIHALVAKKLTNIRSRDEKVVAAAQELCRVLGEFTEQDLSEVLKRIGLKGDNLLEKSINKLMENNVIYEPRRGEYRCLENTV